MDFRTIHNTVVIAFSGEYWADENAYLLLMLGNQEKA
jgi:hypothetical protein